MERWNDKVAVVTGASRGIGKVIAKVLVDHGLKVVGIARNIDSMTEVPGKFCPVQADIRKEEDIVKAFAWTMEKLGPVHVLINNAAMFQRSMLLDGNSEDWKNSFDANVLGLCIATREAINQMRSHQIDGHVVHINSVAGHKVTDHVFMNVYSATKFAVTALTETLRQELNSIQSKIKISSISPSLTRTEIVDSLNLNLPALECDDIADAVCYVLGTPPHVQVHELTIHPVGDQTS